MKKIYYLESCNTCKRILAEINPGNDIQLQEIKTHPILESQLNEMKMKAGSIEKLFSRRAMKYRQWGLNEKVLQEEDYKKYILEEYTFLKRPVIIVDDQIFIGNSKKSIENAKQALSI